MIGDLTFISAYCDRTDSNGAWNYSIPTDASPETVDFDTFLGYAPKILFDAKRFFRWRNYKDYGTGAAGDLIVHLLTSVHTITDSYGPTKIFSAGDLKYWKDGRDAYDVINAIMTYPKNERHDSFQVTTRVNLCDGEGKGEFGIKFVGTNGVITIGWNDFTVKTLKEIQYLAMVGMILLLVSLPRKKRILKNGTRKLTILQKAVDMSKMSRLPLKRRKVTMIDWITLSFSSMESVRDHQS